VKKWYHNKAGALSKKQKIVNNFLECHEMAMDNDGCTFEKIEEYRKAAPDIMNELFDNYQKALFKALRAELHNHPFSPIKSDRSLILTWPNNPSLLLALLKVKSILLEWIITHRGMGNKKLLRKAKRGLEVGVKRPFTMEKVELKNAIEELRLRKKEDETPPDMDDNNASTLGEILQKIRSTRTYDPENPPPQSRIPCTWTHVHRVLVQRGTIKTSRQFFLRKTRRLSPSLFPRPKESKDHSDQE